MWKNFVGKYELEIRLIVFSSDMKGDCDFNYCFLKCCFQYSSFGPNLSISMFLLEPIGTFYVGAWV
jgi:hypothetical protein